MKRYGIYRGVFDPVHNGHISTIKNAIERLNLDKLYVAVKLIGEKNPLSGIEERKEMLLLALNKYNLPIEIIQQDVRGHLIDILNLNQKLGQRIMNICGSDKIIREMQLYGQKGDTFLLINRDDYPYRDKAQQVSKLLNINLLEVNAFNTSSTHVRKLFDSNIIKQPENLDNKIISYILEKGLYKTKGEIHSQQEFLNNRFVFRNRIVVDFPELQPFLIEKPSYTQGQSRLGERDNFIRHSVKKMNIVGDELINFVTICLTYNKLSE